MPWFSSLTCGRTWTDREIGEHQSFLIRGEHWRQVHTKYLDLEKVIHCGLVWWIIVSSETRNLLYGNRDIKILIQKSLRTLMTQSTHVWGSKSKWSLKGKRKRKGGRNRKRKEEEEGEAKRGRKKKKSTLYRFKGSTFMYQLDCRAFIIASSSQLGWSLCKCSFVGDKEENRECGWGRERGPGREREGWEIQPT